MDIHTSGSVCRTGNLIKITVVNPPIIQVRYIMFVLDALIEGWRDKSLQTILDLKYFIQKFFTF